MQVTLPIEKHPFLLSVFGLTEKLMLPRGCVALNRSELVPHGFSSSDSAEQRECDRRQHLAAALVRTEPVREQ